MQHPNPMDEQKKAVIWAQWGNGIPMIHIARAIDKPHATIFSYLRYHGGIEPRQRTRALLSLTLEEREEISRGLATGQSIRSIASVRIPVNVATQTTGRLPPEPEQCCHPSEHSDAGVLFYSLLAMAVN